VVTSTDRDLTPFDDVELRELAFQSEVDGFFDFIDRSRGNAHNPFKYDYGTGKLLNRSQQQEMARKALQESVGMASDAPRSAWEALIQERKTSHRGLTLAGHTALRQGRFVLQTVDVAIFQRRPMSLPMEMAEILGSHTDISSNNVDTICLVCIIRKDAPDAIALPGGMVPNPAVVKLFGQVHSYDSNPLLSTAHDEAMQEAGVDIVVERESGDPFDIESAVPILELLKGEPGGGSRSDTTLFLCHDAASQEPVASPEEDALTAGAIPVQLLLGYMRNGGRMYGDSVGDDRNVARGKHSFEIIYGLDFYEHRLTQALSACTDLSELKPISARMRSTLNIQLNDLVALRGTREQMRNLPEIQTMLSSIIPSHGMGRLSK
jgi:hypothetical protein